MDETKENEINETKENKTIKAKTSSLLAQIIAAVWVAGWNAYKFIRNIDAATTTDFILSGFSIAACFIPVYFNLIMDKIKEIKLGNENNSNFNSN
ncbi:MAG: hypothetical protein MJ168_10915 [Clostridia bacterium]|nr:hypothetical protein [Clostridia bacterium]